MKKPYHLSFAALGMLAAALPDSARAAEEIELEELDAVVVTGTRILRAADDTPNPVMVFDAENIAQSGRTNLTDLLIQNPALVASITNHDSAGSQATGGGDAGVNLLNLRNLGTKRTLVLVNSRRHIAGLPGSAAVDINTMPVDLIERIDVLTGGVSAIYGADGVSGVVNFVTKRDFEGLASRGQGGLSEVGDAGNRHFSATGGRNFAEGRGNVALSYEYNADDRVRSIDRPRSGDPLRSYALVRNPDDFPDDPDVPDRILLNDLRYADSSRDGALTFSYIGFDEDEPFFSPDLPLLRGDGSLYDPGVFLPGSGGLTQGGSSTPLAGYQGDLQPRTRRHAVNLLGSFEVSNALRFFSEGKYVKTDNFTESQPSFDFYTFVSAENPFLPQAVRDAIIPGEGAPFGYPDGLLMSRDHFDLGMRGEIAERETVRAVLGADGWLTGNARYEVSYTYGETDSSYRMPNYLYEDRYYAALDAVDEGLYLDGAANGNIVCRIDLDGADAPIDPFNFGGEAVSFTPGAGSGCAPLNLFGEYLVSGAALDFVHASPLNRARISHHVVSGAITGEVLRTAAGPLGYAVGAEYRKEKSRSTPDQVIQDGLLRSYATLAPERGSFDVKEAFVEFNVPLLRNARFADSLALGAAARFSDYSTVGSTTSWKADIRYAPVRDLMLRGTYSEAVRAPNIAELFAPSSGGFSFIDDPCDINYTEDGSQYRAANCAGLLGGLGIDPATFLPSSNPEANTSIEGVTTGNPLLREETAKTWTAGFVLRPVAAPNLSISFDWYNIKLTNAINEASAEEFAQLCVDQPTLENTYCDAITRNPATGFITGWQSSPQNVANFRTAGADLTLAYGFTLNPDWGRFHFRLSGGYLDRLTFIPTPGADLDDDRGETFAPKYIATSDLTWRRNSVSVNYGINYFSKTRRFTTEQLEANEDLSDPRYFFYKAKWEHDLRFGYAPAGRNVSFYAGVNNLFDTRPAVASTNYPIGFLGRYFYGGVRFDVDGMR